MRIEWKVNYKKMVANCSQMSVCISETSSPEEQNINETEIVFGFKKFESGRSFDAHIINISENLFEDIKRNPQLLAQYGSALGDSFNEYQYDDAIKEKIKDLIGKKPNQSDLARYLGVNRATVSGYPEKKKELMLCGLWLKKAIEKN